MTKKFHLLATLLVSFLLLNGSPILAEGGQENGERSLVEIFDDFAMTYNVFFSYEKSMIEDVKIEFDIIKDELLTCLLYTSPSPRD